MKKVIITTANNNNHNNDNNNNNKLLKIYGKKNGSSGCLSCFLLTGFTELFSITSIIKYFQTECCMKHKHSYIIRFCGISMLTYRLGVKYRAWN